MELAGAERNRPGKPANRKMNEINAHHKPVTMHADFEVGRLLRVYPPWRAIYRTWRSL
jgi:hypothetical protein